MLTSTLRPVRETQPCTVVTTARNPSRVPNWATSQPATSPSPLAPAGAAPAVSGATEAPSTPSSSSCNPPARSVSPAASLSATGSTCRISLSTSATTPTSDGLDPDIVPPSAQVTERLPGRHPDFPGEPRAVTWQRHDGAPPAPVRYGLAPGELSRIDRSLHRDEPTARPRSS